MTSSPFQRELSVWADFNSRDPKHRIKASLRFADSPARPVEGELIRLHDDEGNSVKGVVEEIDDLTVYVRPEMATWTSVDIAIDEPFGTPVSFRAAGQGKPSTVPQPERVAN